VLPPTGGTTSMPLLFAELLIGAGLVLLVARRHWLRET
jgi:LPXTG-motif cell wall-anchored protein